MLNAAIRAGGFISEAAKVEIAALDSHLRSPVDLAEGVEAKVEAQVQALTPGGLVSGSGGFGFFQDSLRNLSFWR